MRSWEKFQRAPGVRQATSPPVARAAGTQVMQAEGKQSSHEETALKRAVRHPKRLELLGYLAGEKTGMEEVELAEALGLTPPLVKYHLEVLRSADLVAHVEGSVGEAADRYIVAVPS